MDVESPKHLERLRDQPEIKAALLRLTVEPDASEARFDRAPKNALYWPPIEALSARFIVLGRAEESREPYTLYQRPCLLIATRTADATAAAYAIAVVSSEGAPIEALAALLRDVCDDYWNGSYFFK